MSKSLARGIGAVVNPFHPGIGRLMKVLTLPDDAFDERFDGAAELEQRYGVRLTRLDAFIRERVREDRRH
jgi:hypothetical protein